MPQVTIDNRLIEVPKGTKVIQAAERLGIYVPRFCFHEALGSVGACRMCAVMFLEGPVKGLHMSCMTEVAEGMVVSVDHPEAQRFRRSVIEWLMLNHPHDCPVCDEGGHCLLQDMTVSGGHGIRLYTGLKRTHHDQDLGPFVAHEMNRCIHCWRCRRFYQEYAGYRDLGAMQIGRRTYFGRQRSGRLESPFSGNLIDLCPTGVFTDKPSRYRGRRWDYERADSVCPHCSLGCAITVDSRYRQVVRVEARPEPAVNGHFICDRGRYGFAFADQPERPRQAMIQGRPADLREALVEAAAGLQGIAARSGPAAVAALGSGRMSLEAQVALERLCLEQGWSGAHFFLEPDLGLRVQEAAAGLAPDLAVSLTELARADFVLAVGVDPMAEAPVLALALRQAWRAGAAVALLDPRPQGLNLPAIHLPLACGLLGVGLSWLIRQTFRATKRRELDELHPRLMGPAGGEGLTKAEQRELKRLARALARSRRPVLVCGTDMVPQGLPALAAGLARLLRDQGQEAGLAFALPEANSLGAVLTAPEEATAADLLEELEEGRVEALVVAECDPLFGFPDRRRLERALDRLSFLVVLDHLPTAAAARAQVFLPTTNLFEPPGASLVNHEGRLQWAQPAHQGGTPISQVGQGGHPPRHFSPQTPGGEPRPAAELLEELAGRLGPAGDRADRPSGWEFLAERQPAVAAAMDRGRPEPGKRLLPIRTGEGLAEEQAVAAPPGQEELELLVGGSTLGGEELASHSSILTKAAEGPALWLHVRTAQELGLDPAGTVRLRLGPGEVEVPLRTTEGMNRRTALLVSGPETSWQQIRGRREVLPLSAFRPGRGA